MCKSGPDDFPALKCSRALFGMRLAADNQKGEKPTDDVTLLLAATTRDRPFPRPPNSNNNFLSMKSRNQMKRNHTKERALDDENDSDYNYNDERKVDNKH